MAVKMALAVGLFIVFCVSPGLKASQVVPEGLIYTEVQKTLVQGVQGVLTCRFYGDPVAVYWRKNREHDDQSLMVVWYDGEVSGPRFDDGSCNIDENYSLIINNVSTADSGRIYCTVSNNKGPLMTNYTDILVLDTAITTNPQVTLQLHQATYGILQCIVHIKARRVAWTKGTTSSANESLVVIENNQGFAKRSGAGYDDDTYNITQEYSLVIKEVQVYHEGLYVCEVTDDTGISFRNHTFVDVVAHPLKPFPAIQECLNADQHDSNNCTLIDKSGMTLTCQALKYYPSINLVFLYGSRVIEPLQTRISNNTDKTKNKTVTIATSGNKELYTCVASNTPGTNGNKSSSVLLHGDEPVKSILVIILPGVFAALILISSVVFCIWKKKQLSYSPVQEDDPHLGQEDIGGIKDQPQEVIKTLEQRVNEVLITHYRRICPSKRNISGVQAEKIVGENRTALFDTLQMLIDWRQSPTSSTRKKEANDMGYEPRNKNEFYSYIGSGAFAWPSVEELITISRHLTQESMKKVCKVLSIDCQYGDANDEAKRFETLLEWRNNCNASHNEKWMQLFSALEPNNLGGLLPALRRPYTYKAELVDLAFHLVIHDLFPIAEEQGVNVTSLVSYRPVFHHSHLGIGTIKSLIELFASKESHIGEDFRQSIILRKIADKQYRNVAIKGLFGYDMSYGELCSISEAINQNAKGRANQGPGMKIPGEVLGNLQEVLQLTHQDINDRLNDTSHQITAYALFKIWKEKPRPSVFNYRAALAHELRIIQMPDLADNIIAGVYITEQTSLAFIEDMVQGLNRDQIRSLGELLRPSGGKEQWCTRMPLFKEISKQICDWVAGWTTGTKGSAFLRPLRTETTKKHRDVNDQLVEHGFLDLAREIMIIEQQLASLRSKSWSEESL